jgi:histidine triad (HIT) family protein
LDSGGEMVKDCIFCKIVKGDIPSDKVYEDEKILVFHDIEPEAPVHVLVIPKTHISSLNDVQEDNSGVISYIFEKIPEIANKLGVDKSGYRIVSNCGEDAMQTVEHIHFHLLAKRSLKWPPG